MFKFLTAAIFPMVMVIHCYAQNELPETKKFDHYIGFQANELLRQLINFNNTSTPINNPYLAIYSISMKNCGWGAHVGVGYIYKKTLIKEEPVSRESRVNDLFYRFGIEKKFMLGKRFECSASLDFTGSDSLEKTFSTLVTNAGSSNDTTNTTVTHKTTAVGGGPRFTIGFHITDKLILGTEAMFYYSSQKQKENTYNILIQTDIFNNNLQEISTSNSNLEKDIDDFSFTLPVALFLIVKF
jgi:hypothetical protein